MPPRKPSPVGAHVEVGGGLVSRGLGYAREVAAEAVQVFLSNPRGWAPSPGDPERDAAFRAACEGNRIRVFVHAPYLVNFASPSPVTRSRSVAAVRQVLARGARIGAEAVVVHAGTAVDRAALDQARGTVRELLLPLLDGPAEGAPELLLEPTAGGGAPLAARVDDLPPLLDALDWHPRVGVCLDTCHAHAAGHDLAVPGGARRLLSALVRAVGPGRLRLVHANDSRDPAGSGRDRHQNIGAGSIGSEPFTELFRHPATRGVPLIVETPGRADARARDIALLKSLRDR